MIVIDASALQQWGGLLASEAAEIAARVQPALDDMVDIVKARAEQAAPVRTGALRGAIRSTTRPQRGNVRVPVAGKVFYARFQEFGTRKMDPNPFILTQANRAAFREFESRVERLYRSGPIYR